jgi:hypothetical protein
VTMPSRAKVKPIRGSAMSKGWFVALRNSVLACPREAEHVYGPDSYLGWHQWAEEMQKAGWRQIKCACGLYLLVTQGGEGVECE